MLQKRRIQQIDAPSRQGYDAIFNAKLLEDIPDAVSQWQSHRIMLVASKGLAANSDRISRLQSTLGSKLVHTKLGVRTHTPYADVRDIAINIQKHNIDCVISVGSCSYSDACKIASLLANNLPSGFSVDDMESLVDKDRGIADSRNGSPLQPRQCKLLVVPTSLSASEWNAVSSATNGQGKKQHFGLWDQGQPDLILLDPELASTSPEDLWLSSGVRCIDPCVELMCNPLSSEKGYEGVNVHAEEGLKCMVAGLTEYKQAKGKGESGSQDEDHDLLLKGILECQFGSREALTGLLIWRVPMGPSHAIGHQLGSVAKVMHGSQARIRDIFNNTLGWQEATASDAIEKFVKSLGLPSKLSEVNVTSDKEVRKIADKTMTDVWGGGKRQMELEDVLTVLNSAR